MLIDDYIDYQNTYQEKYGDKTVILMQVGSFFEAYAIDNEKEKVNIPSFISKEITGLKEFSNFNLTNQPYSKWGDDYLTTFKEN